MYKFEKIELHVKYVMILNDVLVENLGCKLRNSRKGRGPRQILRTFNDGSDRKKRVYQNTMDVRSDTEKFRLDDGKPLAPG